MYQESRRTAQETREPGIPSTNVNSNLENRCTGRKQVSIDRGSSPRRSRQEYSRPGTLHKIPFEGIWYPWLPLESPNKYVHGDLIFGAAKTLPPSLVAALCTPLLASSAPGRLLLAAGRQEVPRKRVTCSFSLHFAVFAGENSVSAWNSRLREHPSTSSPRSLLSLRLIKTNRSCERNEAGCKTRVEAIGVDWDESYRPVCRARSEKTRRLTGSRRSINGQVRARSRARRGICYSSLAGR